MNDLKKTIGKNIIELRKSSSMTQAELAEKINYSDKAVSKWECGDAVPDIAVLKGLADMFSVSVDYLLEDVHESPVTSAADTSVKKRNKCIITALSSSLVWLIATLVFTIINLCLVGNGFAWLAFIYAVPVTAIVLLVFNSIWGRIKYNFIIITVLVWTTLASIYFTLLKYNIWLIFIIGIPAQIIILLWSGLKKN